MDLEEEVNEIDSRFERLEEILNKMDSRFENLESKFESLESSQKKYLLLISL